MKAIATSAARRKEREQTKPQDEASSSGHQPVRPSTRSSSRKSTPATSLQAGNAGSKIITLTPDLGQRLVSDETTKQKPAGSDKPQGRIDFDVDEQADDIPSLSGVEKHHARQSAALRKLAIKYWRINSDTFAGHSKREISNVFRANSPHFRAAIGVDESSVLKPDTATTQLFGNGQQAKNSTYEPVVKAEHHHDGSRPLSPLAPADASQSGRDPRQSSLHSFFRVKKHGVGVQVQPGADASAPTTANDTMLPTYGVLQPVATGISQNGCNVPTVHRAARTQKERLRQQAMCQERRSARAVLNARAPRPIAAIPRNRHNARHNVAWVNGCR